MKDKYIELDIYVYNVVNNLSTRSDEYKALLKLYDISKLEELYLSAQKKIEEKNKKITNRKIVGRDDFTLQDD
jgi:hypothetical protein